VDLKKQMDACGGLLKLPLIKNKKVSVICLPAIDACLLI
jgi:hypothetical protein